MPKPFSDASDWMTLVFDFSTYACTGTLVISFLIASNASCCEISHAKTTSFLHSALNGSFRSANFELKRLRSFTRNQDSFEDLEGFRGAFISVIAS